jgi:hypothetical protein
LIFVNPPQRDHEADFLGFSARRNAATSQLLFDAANDVFAAYADYVENDGNAAIVMPLAAEQDAREALRSNYPLLRESTTYGELLQLSDGRCPMCGFGEASTLDHYLPRSEYPEFSVFAMNLVPSCPRCNLLKGFSVGKVPAKQFLHAFIHQIPSIAVLVCRVDVQPNTILPTFRIRQTTRVKPEILARLSHQFRTLQLAERFQLQALLELGERRIAFQKFVAPGWNYSELRDQLREEARAFRATLGRNHWKTALYRALFQNREFWSGGFLKVQ